MSNSFHIGVYEILGILGAGSYGIVWRARRVQSDNSSEVALKQLHPLIALDGMACIRFRLEMEAMATLKHRNIVPIIDVYPTASPPYFTMPIVEGKTLEELLVNAGRKGFPLSVVQQILTQLSRAVDYIHRRHFVHRDIKV